MCVSCACLMLPLVASCCLLLPLVSSASEGFNLVIFAHGTMRDMVVDGPLLLASTQKAKARITQASILPSNDCGVDRSNAQRTQQNAPKICRTYHMYTYVYIYIKNHQNIRHFLLAKVATELRACKPGEFVKEAAPGPSVTCFEQPVDCVSNKVEGIAW